MRTNIMSSFYCRLMTELSPAQYVRALLVCLRVICLGLLLLKIGAVILLITTLIPVSQLTVSPKVS